MTRCPGRIVRHSNFRMQAPAGDLRGVGTEGWWPPAAPDPERSPHWGGMASSWFVGGVAASLLPRPEDLID
jgi:hypothetical protein